MGTPMAAPEGQLGLKAKAMDLGESLNAIRNDLDSIADQIGVVREAIKPPQPETPNPPAPSVLMVLHDCSYTVNEIRELVASINRSI